MKKRIHTDKKHNNLLNSMMSRITIIIVLRMFLLQISRCHVWMLGLPIQCALKISLFSCVSSFQVLFYTCMCVTHSQSYTLTHTLQHTQTNALTQYLVRTCVNRNKKEYEDILCEKVKWNGIIMLKRTPCV